MKKLYVGNLPYSVNEAELRDMFSKVGEVASAVIILDPMDRNRSKGFGFVEMAADAEADAAIEMYNGKDVGGRALVVNEARPKVERPAGGGNWQRRAA